MTEERKTTVSAMIKTLVIILLAIVCVQGYVIWRVYHPGSETWRPRTARLLHHGQQLMPHYAWKHADPSSAASSGVAGPLGIVPALTLNDRDLFAEMQRLDNAIRESMDQLWTGSAWNLGTADLAFTPRMDLKEEPNQYVVAFDLPGVDKSKIDVQVDGRQLTVSGTTNEKVEKNNGKALYVERSEGQFERSITLPGPVTATELRAKYDNGVLTVTIPKANQKGEELHHVTVS